MQRKNKDDIQPLLIFKLPDCFKKTTLGVYAQRLNFISLDQERIIFVDVERIIKYCIKSVNLGLDATFDQVFSHVISHEYIHFLLSTQVGNNENCSFDNLFGVMDDNPKYIYSGVNFEGDPLGSLLKRHFCTIELLSIVKTTVCRFYTKFINSIRNRIRKVIKCNVKNVA